MPWTPLDSHPFSRPNWAEVDLDALRHNVSVLADHVAPARLLAVIKADAYGHGLIETAATLVEMPRVAALGVASVDEGLALRASGIELPILLLSALAPGEADAVVTANLMPTLWSVEMAEALEAAAAVAGKRLEFHFKVDTGMGRLGVSHRAAAERWCQLRRFSRLVPRGIFTHFACADDDADEMTARQLARFERVLKEIEPAAPTKRHAANSAAVLRYPETHYELVRPGLALFGIDPCAANSQAQSPAGALLKPVMAWKACVTSVKVIAAGESVSYGATWRATKPTRVATVCAGYADGYLRSLSNRGQVLLHGIRCPVVGRVTMDQFMVDTTGIGREVVVGDEVTLFGPELPVTEVAGAAGTIAWELLCAVSRRVPRVYLNRKAVS